MQGLIVVNNANYIAQPYQGWLFVVLVASFGVFVNTAFGRFLPRLEGAFFVVWSMCFIAFLTVLWAIAPRLTAGEWCKLTKVE